eukprot:2672778-Alexandrium_andersonii.AAC.1
MRHLPPSTKETSASIHPARLLSIHLARLLIDPLALLPALRDARAPTDSDQHRVPLRKCDSEFNALAAAWDQQQLRVGD